MTRYTRHKLVAAIHLNSRGFAFVIFEGSASLLDWSIVEARGGDKREKILARIDSLLLRYKPDTIVLQDMSRKGTQRPHRIRRLNEAIAELAARCEYPVALYSRSDVRQYFADLGSATKDRIASAIAKLVPALERQLPPPRKPWNSEDAKMGIFDAAALALTFLHGQGRKSNELVQ